MKKKRNKIRPNQKVKRKSAGKNKKCYYALINGRLLPFL